MTREKKGSMVLKIFLSSKVPQKGKALQDFLLIKF
jgi:hypothetical protein